MLFQKKKAFTLIELLIVVAIIAILAAIAVPNFLEAQVRSKVSRVKNDMRSIATGLESYKVDQNHYPPDGVWRLYLMTPTQPVEEPLCLLTTPVAYMSKIPGDVFPEIWYQNDAKRVQGYDYTSEGTVKFHLEGNATSGPNAFAATLRTFPIKGWCLSSNGPDRVYNNGQWGIYGEEGINLLQFNPTGDPKQRARPGCLYDSTNGTVSWGDIVRWGP